MPEGLPQVVSDPATSALVNDLFQATEQQVQETLNKTPEGVIPENQGYVPNDPTPSPTPDDNPELNPDDENPTPNGEGEGDENAEKKEKVEDEKKDEKGDGDDKTEGEQKLSNSAAKKFAAMRKENATFKAEIKDLKSKIEELEAANAGAEGLDELKAEKEKLASIVNSFAFTQTEEYQKEVSGPYNKAQDKLFKLAENNGMELTHDQLNEIATNKDFDEMDRQEAYEDLARDAGLTDLDVSRFANYAMLRDRAVQKHTAMSAKADEYRKEFLEKLGDGKVKQYEVNLDNYDQGHIQDRAKELGLSAEVDEETVKAARHLAHKIDNNAFMDAALLQKAVDELKELKEQNQELHATITKLRGKNPSPSKGHNGGAPAPEKLKFGDNFKTATDVVEGFLNGAF